MEHEGYTFPRTFLAEFRSGNWRHAQLILEQYLRHRRWTLCYAQEVIARLPWTPDFERFCESFDLEWRVMEERAQQVGWDPAEYEAILLRAHVCDVEQD